MAAVTKGFIVPGKPHPLLAPEKSPAWRKLHKAFGDVRKEIETSDGDLILLYSTQWLSVIGHQIQADPSPKWTHVDEEWHELGSMPYEFKMDAAFAKEYERAAHARGLHARTVAYHGFPIDTGTIVALKLLNPDNRLPACVVSCNMYADRAETLVLGKAARDALERSGKRAIAIAVTSFSNRYFTQLIRPEEDRIYSQKDDDWNRKILEFLAAGRLEDVSQLARDFSQQASGDQRMKAVWWLAAVMGQHNRYEGKVFEYQPVWGTGAALCGLTPCETKSALEREFDEEDVDTFQRQTGVFSKTEGLNSTSLVQGSPQPAPTSGLKIFNTSSAPTPVGAYPHARREGNLLYLSGVGPRQPVTDDIPGGPTRDRNGKPLQYDVAAQTRAVIENVKKILEASGCSLNDVIDVTVFLVNMDRDFAAYNKVYAEYFAGIQATRTTIAITALPTPIAVEFKVIARAKV